MGQHQSKIHEDIEIRKVYHLYEVLGRGSYATVRRGRKKKRGPKDPDVAVKVVKTSRLDDEEKKGLEEEIRILLKLDHPNIVKLHEVYIAKQRKVYLVMELLEGGEMFDRIIEERYYTEATAAFSIVQILDALVYCHSKNVCHRDLKPENLFYTSADKNSKLVIGDFGLAAHGKKLMNECCGTPQYVAPEILQNKPYTNKVDLWSVGVVLYILLCGYPPFYADTHPMLYVKIIDDPFEFDKEDWGSISVEAKDLVSKLLTKDPKKRISAAEAKKHPWLVKAAMYNKSLGDKYVDRMRRFKAVQRLRAGVTTMVAVIRMANIMNELIKESMSDRSIKEKAVPKTQIVDMRLLGSQPYYQTGQQVNIKYVFPEIRGRRSLTYRPTQVRYAEAYPRYSDVTNSQMSYDQSGRVFRNF